MELSQCGQETSLTVACSVDMVKEPTFVNKTLSRTFASSLGQCHSRLMNNFSKEINDNQDSTVSGTCPLVVLKSSYVMLEKICWGWMDGNFRIAVEKYYDVFLHPT